jgi:LAS superfamily LD-carboxypeptidase LdcB
MVAPSIRRTGYPTASEYPVNPGATAKIRFAKEGMRGSIVLLCLLITLVAVGPSHARRQTAAEGVVKPPLDAAAAQNAIVKSALLWMYGGKSQQGWMIYVPLIELLIGAEPGSVDTPGFAGAVARWQQSNQLPPTGVIDDQTLSQMIRSWQSHRLYKSDYPTPDQLIMGSPDDFYDPERVDELRMVERQTFDAYKRLVRAAAADPTLGLKVSNGELAKSEQYLKIISAFRTREYQDQLRRQIPNAGRASIATSSPHFTGRALDLYVGGEPVETKDPNRLLQVQTPVYRWLVKNASRFGFVPYFYEPWHWEFIGNS